MHMHHANEMQARPQNGIRTFKIWTARKTASRSTSSACHLGKGVDEHTAEELQPGRMPRARVEVHCPACAPAWDVCAPCIMTSCLSTRAPAASRLQQLKRAARAPAAALSSLNAHRRIAFFSSARPAPELEPSRKPSSPGHAGTPSKRLRTETDDTCSRDAVRFTRLPFHVRLCLPPVRIATARLGCAHARGPSVHDTGCAAQHDIVDSVTCLRCALRAFFAGCRLIGDVGGIPIWRAFTRHGVGCERQRSDACP